MSAPLVILDRGSNFVVRGNAWPVLTAVGLRPFYVGASAMGFVVDGRHLADLCAYMDAARMPYRLRRGDVA